MCVHHISPCAHVANSLSIAQTLTSTSQLQTQRGHSCLEACAAKLVLLFVSGAVAVLDHPDQPAPPPPAVPVAAPLAGSALAASLAVASLPPTPEARMYRPRPFVCFSTHVLIAPGTTALTSYIVQSMDTLAMLAMKFDMAIDELKAINHLRTNPYDLRSLAMFPRVNIIY